MENELQLLWLVGFMLGYQVCEIAFRFYKRKGKNK